MTHWSCSLERLQLINRTTPVIHSNKSSRSFINKQVKGTKKGIFVREKHISEDKKKQPGEAMTES
ncbi:hypothetical protein NXV86_03890 [Bacteroides sp. BFG-257]|uniref:hypothetical protein n=1 Tax=unclassified Bacteroides TaxID=2646097 RepID=UPI0021630957|nr:MULTISPECIES: hypothetical protein [unclassified Bacteroides]UVO99172.1 hypothetical protein NXV86_03890 [Bacteroides sp. BFG-257]